MIDYNSPHYRTLDGRRSSGPPPEKKPGLVDKLVSSVSAPFRRQVGIDLKEEFNTLQAHYQVAIIDHNDNNVWLNKDGHLIPAWSLTNLKMIEAKVDSISKTKEFILKLQKNGIHAVPSLGA